MQGYTITSYSYQNCGFVYIALPGTDVCGMATNIMMPWTMWYLIITYNDGFDDILYLLWQ